jgi:hypothetical protein
MFHVLSGGKLQKAISNPQKATFQAQKAIRKFSIRWLFWTRNASISHGCVSRITASTALAPSTAFDAHHSSLFQRRHHIPIPSSPPQMP